MTGHPPPLKGDNFRALSPEAAEPILRDWLAFQADADRRVADSRVLTTPDRTEAARAQITYEKARAKTYYDRKRARLALISNQGKGE